MNGEFIQLNDLIQSFSECGVRKLYYKILAENDNTKQQVYFGSSFDVINILPFKTIRTEEGTKVQNFKAGLDFCWMGNNGKIAPAPRAQLILYPDYPEVRFSGFLMGCPLAPSHLMQASPRPEAGRVLFLGVRADNKIIGHLVSASNPIANELKEKIDCIVNSSSVFSEILMEVDSREELLNRLGQIHSMGWLRSQRMNSTGQIWLYNAQNGGGYTLEAQFGIIPNGVAEPDFKGWELKTYGVKAFGRSATSRLTLMTPEPTRGFYGEQGAEAFVRRYGHVTAKPDQLYFTGTHKVEEVCSSSGLKMIMEGYDLATGKIRNVAGGIHLIDRNGELAAGWAFKDILEHWKRKHAQTVYIPYIAKDKAESEHGIREFWYGNKVTMCEGASVSKFLAAFASQQIIYDPAVKVDNVSTCSKVKARSQFRIGFRELQSIYEKCTEQELA